MLKDNLKTLRKNKGLSQEELSVKLNVVRQTVSKWEQELSVPDAEMLISISEVFDTPVSTILGENINEKEKNELKVISEKLEVINLQLSHGIEHRRKVLHYSLISILTVIIVVFAFWLFGFNTPYLEWDYSHTEYAVLGVICHAFVWMFVRFFPFVLIALVVGIVLTRKKK